MSLEKIGFKETRVHVNTRVSLSRCLWE